MLKVAKGRVDSARVGTSLGNPFQKIAKSLLGMSSMPGPNDLEAFLAKAIDKPGGGNVAFFLIAVEDTPRIADQFGKAAAKGIGGAVASAVSELLRDDDLVAPVADDRVGIILTALPSDPQVLDTIAQRIGRRLSETVKAGGAQVVVRTRIGIAVASPQSTPGQLLQRAQFALDQARWTIRPYAVDNGEIRESIDAARAPDPVNLKWLLAPRFETATSRLSSAEVLVDTGLRPQALFAGGLASMADALDLALGALARLAASEEAARFERIWLPVPAAVLRVSGAPEDMRSILAENGVTPGSIGLELSGRERSDIDAVADQLDPMREAGISVRLSTVFDAGATLSDLGSLETDVLRLQPNLTSGISTDPARQQLVAAVATVARALDIVTLAVGIDDADDLDALTMARVDLAQGEFVGSAVAATL